MINAKGPTEKVHQGHTTEKETHMDLLEMEDNLTLEDGLGFVPMLGCTHLEETCDEHQDMQIDQDPPSDRKHEAATLLQFIEVFPGPTGSPLCKKETAFEQWHWKGIGRAEPFSSEAEWKLATWLVDNIGQNATNDFLKLEWVNKSSGLSFKNRQGFTQKIGELPTGPGWECEILDIVGDRVGLDSELMQEELEFWYCNPVDCVCQLLGNPTIKEHIAYSPEKVYTTAHGHGSDRVIDEMWTADWWWQTQQKLPPAATMAQIILASDKTKLLQFQGNKEVWPVYITLGNIAKEVCCQPTAHATVLLGSTDCFIAA
ncbi:hypothetical protein NP233_g13011 [Leucocoprinus birnbaumii]|uniref:Uncharacterized protein n=1 Tax=Leucocoprinus birnbaumii TaxID=56174 RepID=A0AAD5VHM1_9AGAR|nr:hypothetical protein NP233_g13011 [Leucocoprinus birnbaumii]